MHQNFAEKVFVKSAFAGEIDTVFVNFFLLSGVNCLPIKENYRKVPSECCRICFNLSKCIITENFAFLWNQIFVAGEIYTKKIKISP